LTPDLRPTSFKLTDADLGVLDEIADLRGMKRGQHRAAVIRESTIHYRNTLLARREAGEPFIASMRKKFGDDAVLSVSLDDGFDPIVRVDGHDRDDVHVATLAVKMRDGQGFEEDFVRLYLADPDSDFRLLLGFMPVMSGVWLSVPIADLHPEMRPRAVAYFAGR
jgi:hypothetical protein